MKTLIVGGVAGGATTAARLRRLDENAEIIIFERGEYISYANCGLPYYIGGKITDKRELTLQTPESFKARFNVEVRTRNEVISTDFSNKKLKIKNLNTGEEYFEEYDYLVLAPGAKPIVPQIEGINLKNIFTLRNIPDTYKINEFVIGNKPRTVAIIGGGYIGVEMAENLSNAGIEVTIAERANHLIAPLDFDMAVEIHKYLRTKGVKLKLRNSVNKFTAKDLGKLAIGLDSGEIESDMAILSVGVTADTGFLKNSGLDLTKEGRIKVDEHMRASEKNVYAVGDAVEIVNFVTGEKGFIPLAGPANKQGRIAADNICGWESTYKGTQGSSILKVFDLTVATTGINETTAQAARIDYDKVYLFTQSHASYYPGGNSMVVKVLFENKTGKILGAQIVGFEGVDKRIDVLSAAIRGGLTGFDLAELELAYAPPFSSAKDPVNVVGFMIENILTNKVKQYHYNEIDLISKREDAIMLDVRTNSEVERGHIPEAINIPLHLLRGKISQLPKDKVLYVNCQSGLRSYIACRILSQKGFDCYNLAGGYRLYAAVKEGFLKND